MRTGFETPPTSRIVSALSPLLLHSVNRLNTSLISRIVPALSTLPLLLPLPTDSTRWPSSHRPSRLYDSSPRPPNRSFSDLKVPRFMKLLYLDLDSEIEY
ncbi:hypothetical protein DVH24_031976 [Malus domestica]|uniref:Uncharacterized protein n=1 Tax=Malus domestica TaxID=3750 RepID=A0A498J1N0_MALDO|nr:hypothetical protein DVH24_031976 [Malus domestica]